MPHAMGNKRAAGRNAAADSGRLPSGKPSSNPTCRQTYASDNLAIKT